MTNPHVAPELSLTDAPSIIALSLEGHIKVNYHDVEVINYTDLDICWFISTESYIPVGCKYVTLKGNIILLCINYNMLLDSTSSCSIREHLIFPLPTSSFVVHSIVTPSYVI